MQIIFHITHIQQFWSQFHRHIYGPDQCCKDVMCRIRSNQLPETFSASRLIPLDKNSGLRPVRVREVIKKIIVKAVVLTLKEGIIRSVGNLQMCAGHKSGCEATIHAISQIFNEENSEAVL